MVVMAPALTEAGQSQNFKLPPSAHSSPGSPVSVAFNGVKSLSISQVLSDGHSLCKNSSESFCPKPRVNGIHKLEVKKILDPNFVVFENLTTLAIASEISKDSEVTTKYIGKLRKRSNGVCKEGEFMMNQCDPSMGDHQDNMGLQKSNNSVPGLESVCLSKDKNLSSDMDQLLNNLGADMTNTDISGPGDLGTNVEDLLQVIKNMENDNPESDALNSDNVGLGNLDPNVGEEPETMFQMTDGADLTGGLSTFERELLNVDMMNMCVDVNLNDNSLVIENKELTQVRLDEARKKQFEIERKCEWLLRRLRKLQARTIGRHVSEEVTGVLEQTYRMLHSSSDKDGDSHLEISDSQSVQPSSSVGVKVESNFKNKKVKGISSSALSSLFRRLDVLSQQQATISSRQQVPNKYFGAGSGDHTSVTVSNNGISAFPKFPPAVKEEVEQVSGQLHTQLQLVEYAMDSDATASSSGGESCDEMQTFNNPHQLTVSISKRASWRWARDRAGVASRWTWLQAQISDLEYRIRQHNEIHRQIRAAKGNVCLGDPPAGIASSASDPGAGPSPPAGGGGRGTVALPNHQHTLVVNGYHGSLPGGGGKTSASAAATLAVTTAPATGAIADAAGGNGDSNGGGGCSRTRPLVRALFRKRKLLQVAGLHVVSKKAARAATVRCGCQPPLSWCALCTGRADPTAPWPQPDLLMPAERVALLDPCFHPVLSFPEDVPQHIHYEAIMRTSDWQQKTLRSNLKALKASGNVKTEKDAVHERRHKKPQVEHRRKYTSRLKKTAANTLSAKIKRKLTKGRKSKTHESSNHSLQRIKRKRPLIKGNLGSYIQYREEGEDDTGGDSAMGSKYTSPVPSPCSAGGMSSVSDRLSFNQVKDRGDGSRRKRENSYDIDNIVIPYSIAASTRLEKLQYKEIPTPKWRFVDNQMETSAKLDLKNNGVVRRSSQESDVEDMSEETISQRHERCELEERKKFMSYIKLPYSGRGRARRTDSRAESSGANTPDPMSPNMPDLPGESGGSPMTSPPATPLSMHLEGELPPRRRTLSQSRWGREREREEVRSSTPDHILEVPPFEARTYPLSDDVYDKMLKAMPEGHPYPPVMTEPKKLTKALDVGDMSQPASPSTDSTESALGEGEDPNDPEWTVEEEKEFERDRMKTTVKR